MTTAIRVGLVALAFAALELLPVAVMAQNTGTGSGTQPVVLAEVIVTAQKRQERLQDVPVPVTALNASSLTDNGQLDITSYYTSVPGLSVVPGNLGGSLGTLVTIRGLSTGGGNPTVGIVVDDVPFGASTTLGSGGVVPDFDPSELASIEVLRGPQGTLYGANSLGGLLKYVTLDPSTDGFSGRIQVGSSSVRNGNELGYSVRGSANMPVNDTLAVRLSAFTRRDPGYVDNIQTGARDVNYTDADGGRLSALWRLSENFSLKLSALLQDEKTYGLPAEDKGLGDLQQSKLLGTGAFEVKTQAYSLTAHAKLGNADLTAISGYTVFNIAGFYDFTYAFGAPTQAIFGVRGDALGNPADAKNFCQEVRLSVPISSTVDWLVGGVYTHDKSVLGTDLFAVNPATGIAVAPQFLHEPTLTTYEEYAAFTDVTFHFTGRFDLQLGGRESHIAQTYSTSWTGPFVTDIFHQTNPLLPPAQDTRDDTFTYLATPRFKVSSDLMLYARLASGYRPGGPNSNSGINKLPTYSPDKTKNYEIGIKGDVLKHALSFDGSVYYIDWKDMQLLVVDPTTHAGIFVNASTAKSQGLELSVEARPVSGLTLSAWIDLNDAKLTKDLPAGLRGTAVGFDGDKLPVSSRFSGNFSLTHEFRLTAKASGFVGGGVSYIGDRLGNFVPAGPRQNFPSYVRTDLRGGVKYELWAANVFVNNVADKRGLLPSGSTNPNLQYVIQPRTVGLNVSRTF